MVDGALGTVSRVIKTGSDDEGTLYTAFQPDEEHMTQGEDGVMRADTNKIIQLQKDLSRELSIEGSVLLKNENNALPLAKGSRITMLGMRSYTMFTGAGMGYNVSANQDIQLREVLSDPLGANFKLNPAMLSFYSGIKGFVSTGSGAGPYGRPPYNLTKFPDEPVLSQSQINSFSNYNDAAIVVVGRPSGEGTDFFPGAEGAIHPGSRNALSLTNNEKRIIDLACENFNNVIVLVNTNSTMEIHGLKENPKICAILWIGHPGNYGSLGIADILCGDANPSGGLSDIYASNTMSSPAMANMGSFEYGNSNEITRQLIHGTSGTENGIKNYIIEAEGIYVGYRYYETRYYDWVLNQGNARSEAGKFDSKDSVWNYSDEVTYGFGYGLSYSNFAQTIDSFIVTQSVRSKTAKVAVTVKNIGNIEGKSIIQLYAQAPYTQFDKTNGIEKSAIQLVAFEKTPMLNPGESIQMTLNVDFQDLASYDNKVNKTYILDGGDYYFALGNGAHNALNNILAKQGKTITDGMTESGNSSKVHVYRYNYSANNGVDANTFSVSKSGTKVTNQLEYSDWNDYESNKIKHLSRNDWKETWPISYFNLIAPANLLEHLNGNYIDINKDDDVSEILFDQSSPNELKFGHMKLSDFDDPRWDEIMDQLGLQETVYFAFWGGRTFRDLPAINFLSGHWTENGTCGIGSIRWTRSSNDPWGVSTDDPNAFHNSKVFCSAPVVASTFNSELAYKMGKMYGNNAIFYNLPILWGPGLNIHRHPYNGRNGEYFSEDPILTGQIGMEVVMGAKEKGLICAPKHFAFNDQEFHRGGVAPFMTEQRAREIDLRAFQIPFEANKYTSTGKSNHGMLGTMLSFSKLGGIECTTHYGLLTEILRNEWDFNGYVVTDMNDDIDLAPQAYKAGLTCFDLNPSIGPSDQSIVPSMKPYMDASLFNTDIELLSSIKEAAKRNLWVFSQSNMMNTISSTSYAVELMTWWRALTIGLVAAGATLTVFAAAMYAISIVLNNRKPIIIEKIEKGDV